MIELDRKREAVVNLCRQAFAAKTGLPADPLAERKTILQAAEEAARQSNTGPEQRED